MTDQPTPPPTAHTAVTRGPFRDLTAGALVADAALKVHDAIEQWHAMFGTEHDDEPAFRGNIASALYQAGLLRTPDEDEATVERAARAIHDANRQPHHMAFEELPPWTRELRMDEARAALRAARGTS